MNVKDDWGEIKCFGSTTVGSKGQVVIPVNARKELGIDTGATLLVFKSFHGWGLALLKVDTIEQMLSTASERLTGFEKLVKDYKAPEATGKKKGID